MKVDDILKETIDLSKSTPVNFKGKKLFPISGDLKGSGIQTQAYHTGAGTVTKSVLVDPAMGLDDSAVKFLKLIINHQDNPFFPKIYHAKLFHSKDDKESPMLLIVQMEKLISLRSEKIKDAVLHLFKDLGVDGVDVDDAAKQVERMFSLSPVGRDSYKNILAKTMQPKFKEAIQLLTPHIRKLGADLHAGNWMVRLTGTGPQLVMIDPFQPTTMYNRLAFPQYY